MHLPSLKSADRLPGQIDGCAEINAGIALEDHQSAKAHSWIGFRVDGYDDLAAALQEGIRSEIFDMSPIGSDRPPDSPR